MVEKTPAMHADTTKRTDEQHADYWKSEAVFQQIIRVQSICYTHSTCADRQNEGTVNGNNRGQDIRNGVQPQLLRNALYYRKWDRSRRGITADFRQEGGKERQAEHRFPTAT